MQGAGRIYAPAWALWFWLRVVQSWGAWTAAPDLLTADSLLYRTDRIGEFAGNGEHAFLFPEPCSPSATK